MGAAPDCDCLIAGGGMVGASLACALAAHGLRVMVVEAVTPEAPEQPSYDSRGLALSLSTQRTLEAIGVWESLAPRAAPIRRVHISSQGHFGFTRLEAADLDLAAL